MSPVETDRAILLRRHEFSETSFVVTLLSRRLGKLRCLAKGAKRPKSPMNGALEPLSCAEITVYTKPSPKLHILSQARTVCHYRGLRRNLERFYRAHYFAELLLAATPSDLPDTDLYDRAEEALSALDQGAKTEVVSMAFEAGLLRRTGNLPRTAECVGCERPWRKDEAALFHPLSGGGLCRACAAERGVKGRPVRAGTLLLLGQFSRDQLPRLDRIRIAKNLLDEVRGLLDDAFRFLLDRNLRSRRYLGKGEGSREKGEG